MLGYLKTVYHQSTLLQTNGTHMTPISFTPLENAQLQQRTYVQNPSLPKTRAYARGDGS